MQKTRQRSGSQGNLIAGDAANLLAECAMGIVNEVRGRSSIPLEERSELRIRIGRILGDSDAPALRERETEYLPLAPWAKKHGERDSELSLYDALIDCREFINSQPAIAPEGGNY
jgi:hypothetical protein